LKTLANKVFLCRSAATTSATATTTLTPRLINVSASTTVSLKLKANKMSATNDYQFKDVGQRETSAYKGYFYKSDNVVSPFHDIPLWANEAGRVANMVVEIPKGTRPKMEISKGVELNPIIQDTKSGKLRYVAWPYPFNYGAFPQTWENPGYVDSHTGAKGDNDPVDVCDLSSSTAQMGEVRRVKILGTYAMIDAGETDWKILVIDVNDPNADKLNDMDDIEKVLPGKLKEVFEFLRDYKIPDGKPANNFAFGGELKNRKFALEIIEHCHGDWKALMSGSITSSVIKLTNTTLDQAHTVSFADAASKI